MYGNEDWCGLKRKLLDVASEVCGYAKAKCGGGIKLWMWRCRRRELFRIWKQSQNEEDRKKCCEAKKDAKRVVESSRGGGRG